MLIGLVPGLSEPEGHINTYMYLSPIIDDLIALYSGIQINSLGPRKIFSRSILLHILARKKDHQERCHSIKVTKQICPVINVASRQFVKKGKLVQLAR